MGDYEEDGSYNPNVVKFVLNLKNISSEGNTKFLSLEVDERTNQAQMTKTQKYRIQREFRRKTFYPNPPRRCNYVHQIVRFNAYLIIE